MKTYELVGIINPQLSQDDQQSTIAAVEALLPEGGLIQKDDIGLQKVYQFNATNAGLAYFVSWYFTSPEAEIINLKKKLTLVKGLLRSVVYVVDKHNPMVSFKEINEKYVSKLIEIEPKSKKTKLAA